jgi:hypothetical protein
LANIWCLKILGGIVIWIGNTNTSSTSLLNKIGNTDICSTSTNTCSTKFKHANEIKLTGYSILTNVGTHMVHVENNPN